MSPLSFYAFQVALLLASLFCIYFHGYTTREYHTERQLNPASDRCRSAFSHSVWWAVGGFVAALVLVGMMVVALTPCP